MFGNATALRATADQQGGLDHLAASGVEDDRDCVGSRGDPGSRSRCGKDGGVQSRVLRQCRGGSGDSARVSGSRPWQIRGHRTPNPMRWREARHHLPGYSRDCRSGRRRSAGSGQDDPGCGRGGRTRAPAHKENAAEDANPRHRPECARSRRYDGNRRSDREWKRVDQRCQIAA